MPDYAFEDKGMRIDGVTEGRPASKAGLMAGDIVVELAGIKIDNMQDYMKALSSLKKGDKTKVVVKRKDELVTKDIEF